MTHLTHSYHHPRLHASSPLELNDRPVDENYAGRRPSAAEQQTFSAGQIICGVLELVVAVAALVVPIFVPRLIMLPLLAAAGFVLIALALLEDHLQT